MKKILKLMLMIVTVSTIIAQEENATEKKYNINSPHTGPANIDLNFRFGGGYGVGLIGVINAKELTTALSNITAGAGLNLNGGLSFIWKGLMIDQDVDYLQISSTKEDVTNKTSLINTETNLGFTWNRKPNNFGYGYFYVGLKTWTIQNDSPKRTEKASDSDINTKTNADPLLNAANSTQPDKQLGGSLSSTGLGPTLGLRGLKGFKLTKNVSLLYYGSLFLSVAPIYKAKQGDTILQSSITSWGAFGIGAEQGLGVSIDNLGLAFLVKGKVEILFGAGVSTYSAALPAAITFNITKGLSF